MANEFVTRNGFISQNNSTITGSLTVSGSIAASGIIGTVFSSNADTLIITGSAIVTGSVAITGSLTVTQGISGSFSGSGANLFDIPASGITGLNLSQISSGSVSASISPSNGLQVNTLISASAYYGDGSNLTTKIRRHSFTNFDGSNSYDYNGKAPFGSSENANVWAITRLTINAYGATTVASASNASWTDRVSATYS